MYLYYNNIINIIIFKLYNMYNIYIYIMLCQHDHAYYL